MRTKKWHRREDITTHVHALLLSMALALFMIITSLPSASRPSRRQLHLPRRPIIQLIHRLTLQLMPGCFFVPHHPCASYPSTSIAHFVPAIRHGRTRFAL